MAADPATDDAQAERTASNRGGRLMRLVFIGACAAGFFGGYPLEGIATWLGGDLVLLSRALRTERVERGH